MVGGGIIIAQAQASGALSWILVMLSGASNEKIHKTRFLEYNWIVRSIYTQALVALAMIAMSVDRTAHFHRFVEMLEDRKALLKCVLDFS